jgi:hypothetical protein
VLTRGTEPFLERHRLLLLASDLFPASRQLLLNLLCEDKQVIARAITDRRRLALFDLDPSERPLENLTVFAVCAWPAKLPLPGEPMDAYSDEFFDGPNALMMSPMEMSDVAAADANLAMWGWAFRPQGCIALITDRRIIWRPLDGSKTPPSNRPGSYATFAEQSMGQRSVRLVDVSLVEGIR